MPTLSKGANTAVQAEALRAVVSWSPSPGAPDVDASALLVTAAGTVRDDDDFVFYNAPRHVSGSVVHSGKQTGATATDTLQVDLRAVPPEIDRVVIAASADGGTFGQVRDLAVTLLDATSGTEIARFADMGASTETAFVAGELYRRDGGWKFRAVGQGWDSGLAGLATDFGITVDDAPVAPAAPPVPPAPPTPPMPPAAPLTPPMPPLAPVTGGPQFPPGAPVPPGAPTPPAPYAPPAPPVPPAAPMPAVPSPQAPPAGAPVNLDKGRVSLTKGERVSLVKTGAPALSQVVMGLGWDPARRGRNIDLDASVIAFDANGRKLEIVWFMHKREFGGAIQHTGDNLTGRGDGDDEQILVDLAALPPQVAALVFTINSFGGQKFTDISRAFCRLLDGRSRAELVRFDLTSSEPHTGVLMCAVTRTPAGTWEMRALGTFHDGRTVKKMVDPAAAALR